MQRGGLTNSWYVLRSFAAGEEMSSLSVAIKTYFHFLTRAAFIPPAIRLCNEWLQREERWRDQTR